MKDSFTYKRWWRDVLLAYPEQVREEVNNAIIAYGLLEELISLKARAWAAFKAIKEDMDRDRQDEERRTARSRKMREVVRHRWDKEGKTAKEEKEDVNTDVNTDVYTDVYTHVYTDVYTSENTPGATSPDNRAAASPPKPRARVIGSSSNNFLTVCKQQEENKQKEKARKEKDKQKKNAATVAAVPLEARTQRFYDDLVPHVAAYGRDMVRRFFDYWSEPNRTRTKMRWELEPTFELRRRLATWARRDKTFKTDENSRTNHQATRLADALDIMRRLDAEGGNSGGDNPP